MRYLLCFCFFFNALFAGAETLSLRLKNAPTAAVLSYLAEESGKNIVLDEQIGGRTTLRLENQRFEQLLHSLAKINRLQIQQEKGIYYLRPQPEKTPGAPVQAVASVPKLITKTVRLQHVNAAELIESLTKGQGNFLTENGYLHFDERSNSLIIRDSRTALNHTLKLIKQLDQPLKQVAIEARIVTISSENLQELGVRWGAFQPSGNHYKFGGKLEGNGLGSSNALNVNFPVGNGAQASLQIASINSRVLDLELSALEQENSVEIIASPRLVTTNKKAASIKQGTEIPYVLYNPKSESDNVEFKEAVLGLEVTPHLSADGKVVLDLVVTQNAPNQSIGSNALTTIDKQELRTQVFAHHGETIVLGGIFQHLLSKGEDRVPILGSLPVIKRLFSQSREKISKRELVIFVTPHILTEKR